MLCLYCLSSPIPLCLICIPRPPACRLALAGQARCLELLLAPQGGTAGGSSVNLLVRTRGGANALQLAKQQRHNACVQLLEGGTQHAAETRQAALLKVGGRLEACSEGAATRLLPASSPASPP
jgi:hypothetical protein